MPGDNETVPSAMKGHLGEKKARAAERLES